MTGKSLLEQANVCLVHIEKLKIFKDKIGHIISTYYLNVNIFLTNSIWTYTIHFQESIFQHNFSLKNFIEMTTHSVLQSTHFTYKRFNLLNKNKDTGKCISQKKRLSQKQNLLLWRQKNLDVTSIEFILNAKIKS